MACSQYIEVYMWIRVKNLSVAVSSGTIDVNVASFQINDYENDVDHKFPKNRITPILPSISATTISNPIRPEDDYGLGN